MALVALAMTASATATRAEVGKLTLHAEISWSGHNVECPAGTSDLVTCRQHHGEGVVPGLGTVAEQYLFLNQGGTAACPGTLAVLGVMGTFTVATKGTITFEAAASPDCMPQEQKVTLHFPLVTITGGSGIYAGASGTGTLTKLLNPGGSGAFGKDIWDATLHVDGLAFDTTAPLIRGAVTKVVLRPRGAKLTRVAYRITAVDETDGSRPVSCRPPSGTHFRLGRSVVNCSAADKSGNTAHASFTIIVRARR